LQTALRQVLGNAAQCGLLHFGAATLERLRRPRISSGEQDPASTISIPFGCVQVNAGHPERENRSTFPVFSTTEQ
jgi:hypothetical protein